MDMVKSGQVKPGQVKSGQVKSKQVKSGQLSQDLYLELECGPAQSCLLYVHCQYLSVIHYGICYLVSVT